MGEYDYVSKIITKKSDIVKPAMSKIPMKLAFFIVGSCGFLDDMKFQV